MISLCRSCPGSGQGRAIIVITLHQSAHTNCVRVAKAELILFSQTSVLAKVLSVCSHVGISDSRMSKQSYCQQDTNTTQRTKVVVSHRIGVSQAVMSSALAHHKHAGTSEDILWHTHGGNSHSFLGFKCDILPSCSPYILRDVLINFRSLSLAVKRTLDFYVHVIPALHLLGLARGINVN
jgi:hypothetical protein